MTYEQGGHSKAGLGILKAEGDTLTLDDRLTHHYTTGLATVEVSARHADQLVEKFETYYRKSNENPAGKYKTYVIKEDNNPDKLRKLFELLDRHQIAYGQAADGGSYKGYSYRDRERKRVKVHEGDYLVSAYQPKSVLARLFFEPRPELTDSVTYDITAWGQHYAFGLEGYALTKRLKPSPAVAPQKMIDNSVAGSPYAYLARWQDLADMRMLSELLKQDIDIRFASKKFRLEDQNFSAGTLIITRSDNKQMGPKFDRIVQKVATDHNQQLTPVATGFVQSGADFGSSSVGYLKKPRVALLSGEGTSPNRVGEVWHFFDRQIDYPVTMLSTDYFNNIELHKYDVLILPAGNYSDLLDKARMEEIKSWISAGGKLIALGRSNRFLAEQEGFGIDLKKEETDSTAPPAIETFSQRQRERISSFNTGSIYKITMDNSHPLAFGYDQNYFSLKLSADSYDYLEDGWNVGIAKADAHTSGFVGYEAKEKLKNTLTFGVQRMGRGSVVYLVDNPLFRAFWHNGKLLFGNAVFLVGS